MFSRERFCSFEVTSLRRLLVQRTLIGARILCSGDDDDDDDNNDGGDDDDDDDVDTCWNPVIDIKFRPREA